MPDVTLVTRPPQVREQQQGTADDTRLPSKAELRGTVGTVSRKVYEQVINSRNRLSVKLSASNKQVKQLQRTTAAHTAEITAAYDCLVRLTAEVSAVSSMAQTAAAASQYGTDKQDTSAKMSRVLDRVQLLQQVVQDHTSHIDQLRHRKIPVVWYGIAQQVRLMGDFDGWTQGFSLSADDIHDGTFTKFHATLSLPPGQYQVKFVVDGQWRTAPHWPTVETPQGSNNMLHV